MYSKFCVECGVELNINHKFCGKCGKEREEKESENEDPTTSSATNNNGTVNTGGGALPKNSFSKNEKEHAQQKILGVFLLIICAGAFVVPISDVGTFYDESIRCAQHLETISNPEACENRWIYMIGVYVVGIFGVLCLISGFRKS